MSEDYSDLIRSYKNAFVRTNNSNLRLLYEVANNLYDAMILQYEYCEDKGDVKQQYHICNVIDKQILEKLQKAAIDAKSIRLASDLVDLHKKFFSLSARRILKNFAIYIEIGKKKKVWEKTMETMECVFSYADEFTISEEMNLMRVSCMPGLGKSYFGNLLVANIVGNDSNASLLRITYSDDLVKSSTNQTKSIIRSKEFADIFPRYQGIKKLFKEDTNSSFVMIDCEDDTQFYAVTREGQASGKRAKYVIIDDLLKGEIECNNISLHRQLTDRYYSDWSSRADDDKQKTLLLGTMWADTDLLNVLYDKASAKGLIVDSKYQWVEVAKDRSGVFIRIPALDKDGNSTCPKRFSKKYLLEIKDSLSRFLWMAVYQQDPISPEGLDFDWENLQQWDVFPTITKDVTRYASLDPARRGKNYVSMPITYKYGDLFYIRDWLYQKKSMDELYDNIVDRIIEHQLSYLVLENNTDTSLRYVIEEKLKEKRYFGCNITEIYSCKNKEQRIKDHQGYIRNSYVYPKKGKYSSNTEMGLAMEHLTSYSFNYPVKFDDSPDSIAMHANEFIKQDSKPVKVSSFNRRSLGI